MTETSESRHKPIPHCTLDFFCGLYKDVSQLHTFHRSVTVTEGSGRNLFKALIRTYIEQLRKI
jgi:hypothetical protein